MGDEIQVMEIVTKPKRKGANVLDAEESNIIKDENEKEKAPRDNNSSRDLLRPPSDEEIAVEATVNAVIDPFQKLKSNLAKYINACLCNYYTDNKSIKDVHKDGTKKIIKIKSKEHFERLNRGFTKQYFEAIKESFEAFHGSFEGIEEYSIIKNYGIDIEIEKEMSKL